MRILITPEQICCDTVEVDGFPTWIPWVACGIEIETILEIHHIRVCLGVGFDCNRYGIVVGILIVGKYGGCCKRMVAGF